MLTLLRPFAARAILALVLGGLLVPTARAHQERDALEAAPLGPSAEAALEKFAGVVRRTTIDDRVAGVVVDFYALELDDGRAVPLKNLQVALPDGGYVEATGRRNGKSLFVEAVRDAPMPAGRALVARKSAGVPAQVEGTLAMLHADFFNDDRSEFVFEVHDAQGSPTVLDLPVAPEALQRGMQVIAEGHRSTANGHLTPVRITILAMPVQVRSKDMVKAVRTSSTLVILMTFTDSPAAPFTQAQVQSVFAGGPGTGSVTEYFKEVSYGQQLLNATVTSWLPTNAATPPSCDWSRMATLGRSAASSAGYNLNSYQYVVYVFPQVSSCGWIGLGYVGASGVWINGRNTTSVYGHELGHNFGLLHAGSVRCNTASIGGNCSVSEYGDPFVIMGNQSAMHFTAGQKRDLGWIPSTGFADHRAGTAAYELFALESSGAARYGVTNRASPRREYALEYRQPIGFDAKSSPYTFNGPLVRVSNPFETLCSGCDSWSNDSELLDMTPASSTFTDAPLPAGKVFIDPEYGVRIAALDATATSTTAMLQVKAEPGLADFNGDGRKDLLLRDTATGYTIMQLMNGVATIGSATIMSNPAWVATHTADFDGDGKSDIVWRNTATGATVVWLMNGTVMASAAWLSSDPNWYVMFTGDFDGDGRADLLWRNLVTGETAIWLMNGTSYRQASIILTQKEWLVTNVADFNGDGRADLLWRNVKTGDVAMWLMNGTTYTSAGWLSSDPQWQVTHTGDFNGDGKADLVWQHGPTGVTSIWTMNGTTRTGPVAFYSDPAWRVSHVADLNGDGRTDLVWRNQAAGQAAYWLMNGVSPTSGGMLQTNSNLFLVAITDLNGDGRHDLIWRDLTTGASTATLMSGGTVTGQGGISAAPRFVQP
ncbi:MAG: FG-GAP-like repeat-containing protein [Casimicrobiaceae bacterium]